jgi:hypothetical protein
MQSSAITSKLCSEKRERDVNGAVIPGAGVADDGRYRLLAGRYFSAHAITWSSVGNSRHTRASACASRRRSVGAGGADTAGGGAAAGAAVFGA